MALSACDNKSATRSASIPDNVKEDRPIVLKEGQAVVLVPESNKAVMIGAAVMDSRLSIAEIDPDGRNFGVTWNDEESWDTSTTIPNGSDQIVLIDKNGDGIPEKKIDKTGGYRLKKIEWESTKKKAEPGTNGEAKPDEEIVAIGASINDAKKIMETSGFAEEKLVMAPTEGNELAVWTVAEGLLIASYSLTSDKITSLRFVLHDE